MTAEEQPLLGSNGGSNKSSPRSTRRNVAADRSATSHNNNNKTPVLQRKGTSTPCTPESRRKKHESPTWTEKISISLENLKRTFRKAGSEERERTKIGESLLLHADCHRNPWQLVPKNSSLTLNPSLKIHNHKLQGPFCLGQIVWVSWPSLQHEIPCNEIFRWKERITLRSLRTYHDILCGSSS